MNSVFRLRANLFDDCGDGFAFAVADHADDILIVLDQAHDLAHALHGHLVSVTTELEPGVEAFFDRAIREVDHVCIALADTI